MIRTSWASASRTQARCGPHSCSTIPTSIGPATGTSTTGDLAAHAGEHGYHAVIAMVPLDGWLAHPGVIRTFAEHPDRLSICIHGNDHLGPELGRVADEETGIALAARAIRRSRAFELRTGLPVDPVMVPPHEELSEHAAHGLMAAGYEARLRLPPIPLDPSERTLRRSLGTGRALRTGVAGRCSTAVFRCSAGRLQCSARGPGAPRLPRSAPDPLRPPRPSCRGARAARTGGRGDQRAGRRPLGIRWPASPVRASARAGATRARCRDALPPRDPGRSRGGSPSCGWTTGRWAISARARALERRRGRLAARREVEGVSLLEIRRAGLLEVRLGSPPATSPSPGAHGPLCQRS